MDDRYVKGFLLFFKSDLQKTLLYLTPQKVPLSFKSLKSAASYHPFTNEDEHSLRFTPHQEIRHFQFVFPTPPPIPRSYQLIQSGNNSQHCNMIFLPCLRLKQPHFSAHLQAECCHVCWLYHDWGISSISLCWGLLMTSVLKPNSAALPPW